MGKLWNQETKTAEKEEHLKINISIWFVFNVYVAGADVLNKTGNRYFTRFLLQFELFENDVFMKWKALTSIQLVNLWTSMIFLVSI